MQKITKLVFSLILSTLLIPAILSAAPVNVDRLNNDHIEPLIRTDYFKAPYFFASSTSATSTFNGGMVVDNSAFVVDYSSGNVGIGTSTPKAQLDLWNNSGVGASPAILLRGNPGGDTDFWISRLVTNDSIDNDFLAIGETTVPGASVYFVIDTNGRIGVGTSTPGTALSVVGPVVATGQITGTNFYATSTTATSTIFGGLTVDTNALVVDFSSTKAAVGRTNPIYKFDVDGNSDGTNLARFGGISAGVGETALFYRNRSSGNTDSAIVSIWNDPTTDDQPPLTIRQDSPADIFRAFDDTTRVFTITDGGNIGAGTTSPTYGKFAIVGGTIYQSGGDAVTNNTLLTTGGIDFGNSIGVGFGSDAFASNGSTVWVAGNSNAGTCNPSVRDWTGCDVIAIDWEEGSTTPQIISGIDLGRGAASVFELDGLLYVNGLNNAGTACTARVDFSACEFMIFDVSDKINPFFLGGLNFSNNGRSLKPYGKYILVTHDNGLLPNFAVILTASSTAPRVVGGDDINSTAGSSIVPMSGPYVAVSTSIDTSTTFGGEVKVFDLTKAETPVRVSSYEFSATVNALAYDDNYLYIGKANSGTTEDLIVLDVRNPKAFATSTAIDLAASVQSLDKQGDYLYVCTSSVAGNDLRVYDVRLPNKLVLVGGADMGTGVNSCRAQGKRIYMGLSSVAGNDVRAYDLTGIDVQSARIGSFQAGSGLFTQDLKVNKSVTAKNFVAGAGGITSFGSVGVTSASSTATTSTNLYVENGYAGFGTTTAASHADVGTKNNGIREYLQMDSEAGAPAASDCESFNHAGRMIIDHTNDVLYVCNFYSARGWDTITLTD